MDSDIQQRIDKLAGGNNVSGVLVADGQGLCLGAQGSANASMSGLASSIASQAYQLLDKMDSPENSIPTIALDTRESTLLIRKDGDLTLLVIKSK